MAEARNALHGHIHSRDSSKSGKYSIFIILTTILYPGGTIESGSSSDCNLPTVNVAIAHGSSSSYHRVA